MGSATVVQFNLKMERFSYDLEMKMREQNRNNKRTEIEGFDWLIERIPTRVARVEKLHARELSRTQPILRFDVILQRTGQSNYAFSILRFSFAVKRRGRVLIIHWLVKQITNFYRNHSSRSYENRYSSSLQIIQVYNTPIKIHGIKLV